MKYNFSINGGTQLTCEFHVEKVEAVSDSFIPRLIFPLSLVFSPQTHVKTNDLYLQEIGADVYAEKQGRKPQYVGRAICESPLKLRESNRLLFFLDLDFPRLERIEEERAGEDITFQVKIEGMVQSFRQKGRGNRPQLDVTQFKPNRVNFDVSKSEWTEKILEKTGFKHVRLLEIPELKDYKILEDSINSLKSAWKQFSMGKYDGVLVDCRKALQASSDFLKEHGFERVDEEGRKRPDWKKIFKSDTVSNTFGKTFQKICGFTSPGAHPGKSINREDANFSLMTTHALIYYILEKYHFD